MSNVVPLNVIPRRIPSAPVQPQTVRVPDGVEPETYCNSIMRAWLICAERRCGLDWTERVLVVALAYIRDRKVFNSGRVL